MQVRLTARYRVPVRCQRQKISNPSVWSRCALSRRVMEFGETVCEDDPIQIAVSLDNLALQLEESDATWDEAREAKEEAAAIFRALRGMRHQEISAAQNNGAIMHAYAGDMQRAAEHAALELLEGEEARRARVVAEREAAVRVTPSYLMLDTMLFNA